MTAMPSTPITPKLRKYWSRSCPEASPAPATTPTYAIATERFFFGMFAFQFVSRRSRRLGREPPYATGRAAAAGGEAAHATCFARFL